MEEEQDGRKSRKREVELGGAGWGASRGLEEVEEKQE